MFASSLAKFEQIKQLLDQGEGVSNLSMELNALSVAFASITDDYRLLDDEEQEQKRGDFLQVQYVYHEIAMSFIAHILEPLELGEGNMDIDNYKNATEQFIEPNETQIEKQAIVSTEQQILPPTEEQILAATKEQITAPIEAQNKMLVDEPTTEHQEEPVNASQIQSVDEIKEPEQKGRRPNPFSSKPSTSSADDGMPNLDSARQPTKDWSDHSWASDNDWANQGNCSVRDKASPSKTASAYPAPPFNVYCAIMEPIFALEQINQVNESAINLVLTTLISAAEAARKLEFSLVHDTAVIIAAIQRKLDITTQTLWSWQLEKTEPTLDGFVSFLTKRASMIVPIERGEKPALSNASSSSSRALASTSGAWASTSGAIPKQKAGVSKDLVFKQDAKPDKKRAKTSCPRCSADHYLHRCEQFRTLTMTAKLETVDRARLCRNCFSSQHTTTECAKGDCKKCKVKHNSLLCLFNDFPRY